MIRTDLGGIILAGGRSERMGADKALLTFSHSTLIEHLIHELSGAVREVLVVTREPEKFRFLSTPVVTDLLDESCALSGLHAGLSYSTFPFNFVLACDLPLFDARLVANLAGFIESTTRIVVPHGGKGFESLCAVYSRELLPSIESNRAAGRLALQDLYEPSHTTIIDTYDLEEFTHPDVFFNMNSQDDYRKALELFETLQKRKTH